MRLLLSLAILGLLVWESKAIRGGSATSLVYNPHLVSVSIGDDFACAGSLLTLDWVITVASCVQDVPVEKLKVRAGSPKTNGLGQVRNVEKVLVYPMFNWYTQDYDLALLRVDEFFTKGPKVRPIQLAKNPIDANETFVVVGWGENEDDSETISPIDLRMVPFDSALKNTYSGLEGQLKKLEVSLVSTEDCKEKYKYDVISSRMVCSWVDTRSSPCWDDFGNPLKNRWGKLVGLYTWSRECAEYPSVYTYLHPYLEWIATAVPDLSPKDVVG